MGIGNFFRHPLQVIGDSMYQQEPIFAYPTIDQPLSVHGPDGTDIDLSGQVPLDPANRPQQVGTRSTGQKTRLGHMLTEVLPRAIEGGMAGMATPNIAGGGALDFARAFQAGGQALRQRDIDSFRMAQMQQHAAAKAAEDAAQRDLYQAHADLYRHQTAQPAKQNTETVVLPPGAVLTDKSTGEVLYSNPIRSEPKPIIAPPGSSVINPQTGEELYHAPDRQKPDAGETEKARISARGEARTELADQLGLQGDDRKSYIATGTIPHTTARSARTPVGPKPLNPAMQAAGNFLAQAGGDAAKARALATQAAQTDQNVAANLQPILKGIDSAREHTGKQDSMQKLRGLFGAGAAQPKTTTADPLGIR
jgi:hypothetical protein